MGDVFKSWFQAQCDDWKCCLHVFVSYLRSYIVIEVPNSVIEDNVRRKREDQYHTYSPNHFFQRFSFNNFDPTEKV